MSKKLLKDCAYYVTDRISSSNLTAENYIGVDNMLPNKSGVTLSESVPTSGDVTAFNVGDILIGNIRPYFKKIWLATFDGGCSPDVLCIRCNRDVPPEYLYGVLSQDSFFDYDMAGSKGSKMPRGDKNHIMNYPIPILNNMSKIGNFIIDINAKISTNNRINDELESMAKTIYDYWFTQFDFPDENGKPYKSSGGKMVWNEELKREIPEGWGVGTLSEYIGNKKGGDWGNDTLSGNYNHKVSCIRGADFPDIMTGNELKTPTRFILEKNAYKILKPNDIIIEISGGSPTQSTGRICYINENVLKRFEDDVITSNFCKAFSVKETSYLYFFYIKWSQLYENGVFFKYEGKTTGIKNLLFDMLCDDYKIEIPPIKIIEMYNAVVSPLFEKIQKNNVESQQLASLRDWLLPMLMNGQVGFKEE